MERRKLMSAGLAASVTTLLAPAEGEAAAVADDGQVTAAAIGELRRSLERQFDSLRPGAWRAIGQIREQQRVWLRSTQKFPDFIEIGIGVWESLYDWHVNHQQPLSVTRLADGRYAMVFMFTTLLLRPDVAADYISPAFDNGTR